MSIIIFTTTPGGGGIGDDSVAYTIGTDAVTAAAESHTITHSMGSATARLTGAYTNWPTTVWVISKATNTITIGFTDPAPASASLDWRVQTT